MTTSGFLFKISVIVILLISSCGHPKSLKNNSLPVINLADFLTLEKSDVKLSAIADSISYIKLKTPSKIIVGNILSMDFSPDKVIVVDSLSC